MGVQLVCELISVMCFMNTAQSLLRIAAGGFFRQERDVLLGVFLVLGE